LAHRRALGALSAAPADGAPVRHRGGVAAPGAGRAHFELGERLFSLEPVLEQDARRLFFTFADETNHTESYPAGRFLYATPPAGDEVVLDFNMAFNPPCAFTAYATCPITPQQNRLPVAVSAGEKRYAGETA
jgi:uncharacterized protein (DUF1684 family)